MLLRFRRSFFAASPREYTERHARSPVPKEKRPPVMAGVGVDDLAVVSPTADPARRARPCPTEQLGGLARWSPANVATATTGVWSAGSSAGSGRARERAVVLAISNAEHKRKKACGHTTEAVIRSRFRRPTFLRFASGGGTRSIVRGRAGSGTQSGGSFPRGGEGVRPPGRELSGRVRTARL